MVPLQNGDSDLKLGRNIAPNGLHSQRSLRGTPVCLRRGTSLAARKPELGIRQYSELRHVAVSTEFIEPAPIAADVVVLASRPRLAADRFYFWCAVHVATVLTALTASERLWPQPRRDLRLEPLRLADEARELQADPGVGPPARKTTKATPGCAADLARHAQVITLTIDIIDGWDKRFIGAPQPRPYVVVPGDPGPTL
jgi:hypothetical protein